MNLCHPTRHVLCLTFHATGNEDYQSLLSVMSRLEALREKTLSDLDKLHDVRNDALSCPEEFVRKLQYDPDVCSCHSLPPSFAFLL